MSDMVIFTQINIFLLAFSYMNRALGKMWYGINSRQQAAGEFTYNCYYNC